ncbi:matrilin-3-like, partial [Ruditapes philippinarum]|uniref:matrilin-3-like n=1 Tax=Ruditapes philippinarum TaxID=129788 RepID=UPI00295B3E6F
EKAVVTTEEPGCKLAEVDLVINIDASSSMTESNFLEMLDFCKDIVDYTDVDSGSARIGILVFSTDAEIQFHLNKYNTTAAVKAAIDKIEFIYGRTNTAAALRTMHSRMFTRSNGDRPEVPNVGILLTDGVSNLDIRRTIPEANNARTKDIELYAIGIKVSDTQELDSIANTPTDQFRFLVKTFEELAGLTEKIICGERFGAGCGNIFILPERCL